MRVRNKPSDALGALNARGILTSWFAEEYSVLDEVKLGVFLSSLARRSEERNCRGFNFLWLWGSEVLAMVSFLEEAQINEWLRRLVEVLRLFHHLFEASSRESLISLLLPSVKEL